jgi:hypothetical protein
MAGITLSDVKRSITSALVVAAAWIALAGCGTGMNSQTANTVAAVPGVSAKQDAPGGLGTVSVNNAMLAYPGTEGYKAGSEATVHAWLFNDTPSDQTVVIKADGRTIMQVTIKSRAYVKPDLKIKVNRNLNTAESLPVTFEFVGFEPFNLQLPVAPPLSPVPAATIELAPSEGGEGH